MSIKEKEPPAPSPASRLGHAYDVYVRLLSAVMMVLGLHQWAIIVGLLDGQAGPFEAMPIPWKLATMHLAVVDLVASVGLWQRVAWGNVVWIYAALSVIAMHTAFAGTFGGDILAVAFHALTLAGYLALFIAERRLQKA